MNVTLEKILGSTNIQEFSSLCSEFECSECSLREEAWVLNQHKYPVANDYQLSRKDKYDLVLIGSHLQPGEGKLGATFINDAGLLIRGALEEIRDSLEVEINYLFLNVCMCETENNRKLEKDEIEACKIFLYKQLSLINPNCLVLLGSTATKTILELNNNISMKDFINKQFNLNLFNRPKTIPALVAYHPSYFFKRQIDFTNHYLEVLTKAIKLSRRYKI